MTNKEKKLLTVVGTVVVLVSVAVLVLLPYVKKWQFYDKAIDQRTARILTLKRQIANKPALEKEIRLMGEMVNASKLFFPVADKAAAESQLLSTVKKMIENAGGQINSVNIVNQQRGNISNSAAVKINFTIDNNGLVRRRPIMRTRAQRRNTISAWLTTLILLTGVVAAGIAFWAFSERQSTLAQVKSQQATPDADLPVLVDEDSLKIAVQHRIEDSVERPLWASTRRPYVAPPPEKKPPPITPVAVEAPKVIPPLDDTLTSIIIAGGMKIIFLQGGQGTVRLEEGMHYNGWELRKINEDSAEFHLDEEKKVLQLRAFATVDSTPLRSLGEPKQQ